MIAKRVLAGVLDQHLFLRNAAYRQVKITERDILILKARTSNYHYIQPCMPNSSVCLTLKRHCETFSAKIRFRKNNQHKAGTKLHMKCWHHICATKIKNIVEKSSNSLYIHKTSSDPSDF